MMEYFRGVVWPRKPMKGLHRYIVLGLLVTDQPIPEFEGKSQLVLDGITALQAGLLLTRYKETDRPLGTANDVLLQLDTIAEGLWDEDEDEDEG